MADQVNVSTDELSVISQRLATAADDLRARLRMLGADVESVASDWSGEAAAAFGQSWQAVQAAVTGICDRVAADARGLAEASTRYEAAESGLAARLRGVRDA